MANLNFIYIDIFYESSYWFYSFSILWAYLYSDIEYCKDVIQIWIWNNVNKKVGFQIKICNITKPMRRSRLYIIISQQKQLLLFMVRFRYMYTGVVSHKTGDHAIVLMDIKHTCISVVNYSIKSHTISPIHNLLISNSFYGFHYRISPVLFLLRQDEFL